MLVSAVLPEGKLVFGGHPAITPMIRLLAHEKRIELKSHISLFQSRFFEKQFPPEVKDFENLVLVEARDPARKPDGQQPSQGR